VLGILLLCSAPGLPHRLDSANFSAEDLRRIEQQVHQSVNQERSLNRMPALKWNKELAAEARRHARHLAGGDFFSHVDPSRGDIDARLDQAGLASVDDFSIELFITGNDLRGAETRMSFRSCESAHLLSVSIISQN
jgi:hypothetical protein